MEDFIDPWAEKRADQTLSRRSPLSEAELSFNKKKFVSNLHRCKFKASLDSG
jgi:hypothetical protein